LKTTLDDKFIIVLQQKEKIWILILNFKKNSATIILVNDSIVWDRKRF
jgi:hypothetical protein